jgi:hypothetical protein
VFVGGHFASGMVSDTNIGKFLPLDMQKHDLSNEHAERENCCGYVYTARDSKLNTK